MDLPQDAPAKTVSSVLAWLTDGFWPDESPAPTPAPPANLMGKYRLERLLAEGDVTQVFLGSDDDGQNAAYVIKRGRSPAADAHLKNEARRLTSLRTAAAGTSYLRYLPELVESIRADGGFANAFRFEPSFYTLEQVHTQHPALDGRHLAWIFKRLLTVLGFSHRQETIHGAVLPCHVLIHPGSHGLQLVGWGASVRLDAPLMTKTQRYEAWYPPEVHRHWPVEPATDLFLAGRCMVYLAGGDPRRGHMPDAVPAPMQRFFRSCVLEGMAMRPHDAWALLDEFDALLLRLYGEPRFHELTLT